MLSTHTYPILDSLKVSICSEFSRDQLNEYFQMAARINKKRSFLFVSRVLAKHLPCRPEALLSNGALLADRFAESKHLQRDSDGLYRIGEATLFIGFAETATGLAQSVFEQFSGNALYCHTTRDELVGRTPVTFKEEHSHATDHNLYLPDRTLLGAVQTVVLIDDELTTGKTALNIIREIHDSYGIRDYYVLSLLDWRLEVHQQMAFELQRELDVRIEALSLINGTIAVDGALKESREDGLGPAALMRPVELECQTLDVRHCFDRRISGILNAHGEQVPFDYNGYTGRFGLTPEDQSILSDCCRAAGALISESVPGKRLLFLGLEELIYIPVKIAAAMERDVYCQSITRSPIYCESEGGYLIHQKQRFGAPKFSTYENYFYNVSAGEYDGIAVFFEGDLAAYRTRDLEQALAALSGTPVYWICV